MIRYLSTGVSELAHLLSAARLSQDAPSNALWLREWAFLGLDPDRVRHDEENDGSALETEQTDRSSTF